jgi:hypothetical protein
VKEITPAELLGQLRDEVQLVAAGPEDQERWLMEHRTPVDEIALQLNDSVMGAVPQLEDAGLMTAELAAALQALDDHFASFSGRENTARWSEEALHSDPAWEEARGKARTVLGLIDAVTASL